MDKNINPFNWFPNHGDEDGNNSYTIIYGDVSDPDHVIVGAEDTEADANEACKRLNEILKKHGAERPAEAPASSGPDWKRVAGGFQSEVFRLQDKNETLSKELQEVRALLDTMKGKARSVVDRFEDYRQQPVSINENILLSAMSDLRAALSTNLKDR